MNTKKTNTLLVRINVYEWKPLQKEQSLLNTQLKMIKLIP